MIDQFQTRLPEKEQLELEKAHLAESPSERMRAIRAFLEAGRDKKVIVQYLENGSDYRLTKGLLSNLDGPNTDGKKDQDKLTKFRVILDEDLQEFLEGKNYLRGFGQTYTPMCFSENPLLEKIARVSEVEEGHAKILYEHVDLIKEWYVRFGNDASEKKDFYQNRVLNPNRVLSR